MLKLLRGAPFKGNMGYIRDTREVKDIRDTKNAREITGIIVRGTVPFWAEMDWPFFFFLPFWEETGRTQGSRIEVKITACWPHDCGVIWGCLRSEAQRTTGAQRDEIFTSSCCCTPFVR